MTEPELTGRYQKFLADNDDAKAIWKFLNERETIIRMTTATYLKRPALEAITGQLLDRFGHCFDENQQSDKRRIDEFKRLTGHMVGQVMAKHGYHHARSGLKVRTGIFATASLFAAKEGVVMSSNDWEPDDLNKFEQLDYLWSVIKNLRGDEDAMVFLGTMGRGYAPNYLIERSSGEQETYSGLTHEGYSEADTFDRAHLSKQGFKLSTLREVFDQQSKSQDAATELMTECWKENKHHYLGKPPDFDDRAKILALSTAGTPIGKAIEIVLGDGSDY